jgi:hypothetical protein
MLVVGSEKMKSASIFLLLSISLCEGCSSWRYETSHSSEIVELFDNETILLNKTFKSPKSITVPFIYHGEFFFGDRIIYQYSFEHQTQTICKDDELMNESEIWLLLNKFEGNFYVWTVGFAPAYGYRDSNFYLYDMKLQKWQKIDRSEFPKSIAVKNLGLRIREWVNGNYVINNDRQTLRELNPSNQNFTTSSTAHLWSLLETGTCPRSKGWSVDNALLEDFKQKYIEHTVPIYLTDEEKNIIKNIANQSTHSITGSAGSE